MIKATDSLSATGRSAALVMTKGKIRLSGTWAGTVNVQTDLDNDATWSDELSPDTGSAWAFTGNGTVTVDHKIPAKTAIYFTRTSGTLVVDMLGEPSRP